MTKRISVQIPNTVYDALVARAGGPRKISDYLAPLLQQFFLDTPTDIAVRDTVLEERVAQLERKIAECPPAYAVDR